MKKITRNLIIAAGTIFGANYILKRTLSKRKNSQNNNDIKEDIFVDEPCDYDFSDSTEIKNQSQKNIVRINNNLERKYFEVPIQKVKTPQSQNINQDKKAM